MKKLTYAIFMILSFMTFQYTVAQEHAVGLGIIIGEPTGISAKFWTSQNNAIDVGLGWSMGGDWTGRYNGYMYRRDRVHIHMDYLWHAFDALRSTERFPLYYGFGGRINSGSGYESSLAIRGVFGIAWMPRDTPIDVFLELVPSMQLSPGSAFCIDAAIGVRYFF